MERAGWLQAGYGSAQARFLMLTAITHHWFSSPVWGGHEIRRLHAELREIDVSTAQVLGSGCWHAGGLGDRPAGQSGMNRRPAERPGQRAEEVS